MLAQTTYVSPPFGDTTLIDNTFQFKLSCVPGRNSLFLNSLFHGFKRAATTTHDKISNLSVRMCDSMLTVKDGPGVYRGQIIYVQN